MYYIDCKPKIPTKEKTKGFNKNCWIGPKGDVYCFEGAHHEIVAAYIGCFILNLTDDPREKGKFFNQSWEGYLLKQGWVCIKNLSWLAGEYEFTHYYDIRENESDIIYGEFKLIS